MQRSIGNSIFRMGATATTINTLKEVQYTTPVSAQMHLAMLIKKIICNVVWGEPRATRPVADALIGASNQVGISTMQERTSVAAWDKAGTLFFYDCEITENSGVVAEGCGLHIQPRHIEIDYGQGIIVADNSLSLYVLGELNTALMRASAILVYELVELTPADFFAAVTAVQ